VEGSPAPRLDLWPARAGFVIQVRSRCDPSEGPPQTPGISCTDPTDPSDPSENARVANSRLPV